MTGSAMLDEAPSAVRMASGRGINCDLLNTTHGGGGGAGGADDNFSTTSSYSSSTMPPTTLLDYSLAETRILISGSVVFFAVLPFVLFNFRCFPIGTTSALLLGALLMVVCHVVSQEEVYAVIGHRDNMTTIFLLLGMMLLAQYFEREQLLMKLLRRVLKPHFTFTNYIWRVCLLSFVLSALFTNDASCAILTPLLLKVWEVQERPTSELESILLGIATSSNIGSVVTVFGNPQMALIAARTSTPPYRASRLDLRRSLLYLGPPAIIGFCLNLAFLMLHQRLRTRHIENSKLISENSHSEQEMAGLTAATGKDGGGGGGGGGGSAANGVLKYDREDFLYEGMAGTDRALPCQLETIHEDEVLEITSTRSEGTLNEDSSGDNILQVGTDSEPVTSDGATTEEDDDEDDDDDEDESQPNQHSNLTSSALHGQANSLSLDIDYKPSALQPVGANPTSSSSSLTQSLGEHSLRLSERLGVYRSIGAFSAADFLPPEAGRPLSHSMSSDNVFSPSDSVPFQVFIILMLVTVIALFLASGEKVLFDMGLVPMAAAILSIVADALLNRQMALVVMRRVDWSIIMMFFGMFVYMHGLNATRLPRWLWHRLGLAGGGGGGGGAGVGYLDPARLAVLAAFILIGSNIFSNVPLTLIVLEQLEPCSEQLGLVVYLAWCATVAGNLTLFGSVANLIVAQKAQQTVKHRLSFFGYLRYGLPTTLVIVTVGMVVIYGFLRLH